MTKSELRERLLAGETMDSLFVFTEGQECDIYKADEFKAGEDIIYIPDLYLNNIPVDEAITPDDDLDEILSCCYTGNDFIDECDGDEEKAERLFYYCDWQNPSSAVDEIDDDVEEIEMSAQEFYMHRLEETRKGLMDLIAKVEMPTGDRLSQILIDAVNKVEELQEELHESEGEE